MKSRVLSQQEISQKLPQWEFKSDSIHQDFQFENFKDTFEFMSKVAIVCEEMNHHPIWINNYNKLQISLQTHDQFAVTELDLELAQKIDLLFQAPI